MRALVQRVVRARVTVDGLVTGAIERGLVVFVVRAIAICLAVRAFRIVAIDGIWVGIFIRRSRVCSIRIVVREVNFRIIPN